MNRAAEEGVMPVQMSYSGFNFDILTGLSALILGLFLLTGACRQECFVRGTSWDFASC